MSSQPSNPPVLSPDELSSIAAHPPTEKLRRLIERYNAAYTPWSELRRKKLPEALTARLLWGYMKQQRLLGGQVLRVATSLSLYLSPMMQAQLYELDKLLQSERLVSELISPEAKQSYRLSSLMEEAIRSSQIEGAATTRRVAKDMLRRGTSPRTKSERMIANNYAAMGWIKEQPTRVLDIEALQELHRCITKGTLAQEEDAGRLRSSSDEVVVEDVLSGEIVHYPPSASELQPMLEELCRFFNEPLSTQEHFLHPILRGIVLHFLVGYIHPFVDGNGRTARALFYWYMLRSGYDVLEYLSISEIIYDSKRQYENAYLEVEADGLDLGYFVCYHLRVLERAVQRFRSFAQQRLEREQEASSLLRLGGLNERQAQILGLYRRRPELSLTAREVQARFGISAATALSDLSGLVAQGFLEALQLNKVKRAYVRSAEFDRLVGD